jgi:hypothetical protein
MLYGGYGSLEEGCWPMGRISFRHRVNIMHNIRSPLIHVIGKEIGIE